MESESKQDHEQSTGLVHKAEEKVKNATTLLWNEIPAWLQDNHYIHSGYRPPSNSYAKSFSSLASLHNESVNIWTHLIGAALAALAGVTTQYYLRPRFVFANHEDVMVFSCFFIGAVGCLGMSATYHTLSNHSEAVAKMGNRLDYMGIVLLIWGSFIPSIYYGFSAEPGLRRMYWTMITSIGAGTLIAIFYPKFRSPEWRPFRAGMFVAMGLSAVVPVLHGWRMYGYEQLERQIGLSWLVAQGGVYIAGALLYAARVPEKWMPGAFDIWGSSHQIFHILVVLAAATHFVGLIKAFDHEHSFRCATMSGYEQLRKLGGP